MAAGLGASLLVALLLGGCGPDVPDESSITGLHFSTSSEFPDNPKPTNVDVTLSDPAPSRGIYAATLALRDFPDGTYNCPADFGYRHTIVFMSGPQAAVNAVLNTGGCRDATVSGAPPRRQTDDAYWTLVAQNLGVERSTLFSTETP